MIWRGLMVGRGLMIRCNRRRPALRPDGMRLSSIRWVPTATLVAATALAALTVAACGPSSASSPPSGVAGGTGTAVSAPTSGPGASSTGSPTAASTPTDTVVGLPPGGPTGGSAVPASQINASGMPGGGPSGVWTQNGGLTVALGAEQAGCDQPSATVTSQTATQVVLRLTTVSQAKPGTMCPMIVRQVVVEVQLAAPLGNRTLVLQGSVRHS